MTIYEARPEPARFADDELEQLRLLTVFHYVAAGLIALLSLFPALQLVVGLLMASGRIASHDEGNRVLGWLMASCASFFLIVGLVVAAAIALAGRSIAQRRRYTYVLVVAGLLCLLVPLGTLLGVFTIVVLVQPSVRMRFPGTT